MARFSGFFGSFCWWLVLRLLFVVNAVKLCVLLIGDLSQNVFRIAFPVTPTQVLEGNPSGDDLPECTDLPQPGENTITSFPRLEISSVRDRGAPKPSRGYSGGKGYDARSFRQENQRDTDPSALNGPLAKLRTISGDGPSSDELRSAVPCWDLEDVMQEVPMCTKPSSPLPTVGIGIAKLVILRATKLHNASLADRNKLLLRRAIHLLDHIIPFLSHDVPLARSLWLQAKSSYLLFSWTPDISLLDRCIEACRGVLSLHAPGRIDRREMLILHGDALRQRYQRRRDVEDLDQGIESYQEALEGSGGGMHRPATEVAWLATLFLKRHERRRKTDDLNNAIHLFEEALFHFAANDPSRIACLNNLGIALFARFERFRNIPDVEEAIIHHREALTLQPRDHPERPSSLSNLGNTLLARYERSDNVSDIEEAINHHREALSLRAGDHPSRSSSLNNLAVTLLTRYRRFRNISDVDEAIARHREALLFRTADHPNRSESLSNLAIALIARYKSSGDISEAEEAISHHRQALLLRTGAHPDRPSSLSKLASALIIRYRELGDISDIQEAITHSRESLSLRTDDHPDRPLSLNNLANAYLLRYERLGNILDLEGAIVHHREALALRASDHPDRPSCLNNLGIALITRYEKLGNITDVEEAITRHREAMSLKTRDHPDHPSSLNNLAVALITRYKKFGNISDAEEAIAHHREVLSLWVGDHPARSSCLNNLGMALIVRYERLGNFPDVEEAIIYHREALSLRASEHPNRPSSLSNLAKALAIRYGRFGNIPDMEEVITCNREALSLRAGDHPDRSSSLTNLGNAYITRYKRLGNISDLEEAIAYHREALSLQAGDHPDRLTSLNNLANALVIRCERSRSLSSLGEAISLLEEAYATSLPDDPVRSAYVFNLGNLLRAQYEMVEDIHNMNEAVGLYGDALSLRPGNHPDRSAALQTLGATLIWRARDVSDIENGKHLFEESLPLLPNHSPDRQTALLNFLCFSADHPTSDQTLLRDRCTELAKLTPKEHPDYSQMTSLIAPILHTCHGTASELTTALGLDPDMSAEDATLALLQSGSRSSASPSIHQLGATCHWILFSEKFGRHRTVEMYRLMLDHLHIAISRGSSLDVRHQQLSRRGILRAAKDLVSDGVAVAIDQDAFEVAVEFLERGRSILLAQLADYRATSELDTVAPDLARRFEHLSLLVECATFTEGQGLAGTAITHPFEDPISRSDRLKREWDLLVDEIRSLEGFKDFLKPRLFPDLQNAAAQGPVIFINVNRIRSDAIIVTSRHRPVVVSLPSATPKRVNDLVSSFRGVAKSTVESKARESLRSLWDDIAEPIVTALEEMPHVPKGSRIWWCPAGAVMTLPLHAAGEYPRGRRLPDLYVSSYTSTLSALLRTRNVRSVRAGVPNVLLVGQSCTPKLRPLPAVPEEIARVKNRMPNATVIEDEKGTRNAVLSAVMQHQWVHLSCHGDIHSNDPLQSHFALHDGPLTVLELMQSRLPDAELAFLSCCHSASGNSTIPDEFLHLTSGVQFAGFKSVVGTMWEMNDEVGPMLADEFYRVLLGKKGKGDYRNSAKALSDALKILRRERVPLQIWINFVHWGA